MSELSADEQKELEKLKLLFDYTKFHIGLYTTLGTGVIALLAADFTKSWQISWPMLWLAICAMAVAGFAGGVVTSSLTQHTRHDAFWQEKTGPYNCKLWTGETFTYIEHTAFWAAVILAVASVGWGAWKAHSESLTDKKVQGFVRGYVDSLNASTVSKTMDMIARDSTVSSIGNGKAYRGPEAIRTALDENLATPTKVALGSIDVVKVGPETAYAVASIRVSLSQPVQVGRTIVAAADLPGTLTVIVKHTTDGLRIIHQHYSLTSQ